MPSVSDATLARIKTDIDYDPDTGEMRWRIAPAKRVQPGDFAGSWVKRDKRLVVGINNQVLPATSVAWYLAHGEWPDDVVKLEVDPDRPQMALPLNDLYLSSDHYSSNPKARYARTYRRRLRAAAATSSKVRGVRWRDSKQIWECCAPGDINKVYASFEKKRDAERYQRRLLDALAWLNVHPPRIRPGDDQIFATGDNPELQSMCLAEAKLWFANTPSGLVYRDGPFPGAPAGYIVGSLTTDRPMVLVYGRYLSVASIAWFIAHGEWPRRKAITFRDGDPTNTRLDNLRHRDRPD